MSAITGETRVDENAIMSSAVYLKNFCGTVIKNATAAGKNLDNASAAASELLAIIKIFVQGILSPHLEMKFKHNLTQVLSRLLFQIQQMDKSAQQTDSFTLLSEFVASIRAGLESKNFDTIIGALHLAECAFTVAAQPDKFQRVFEALQQ